MLTKSDKQNKNIGYVEKELACRYNVVFSSTGLRKPRSWLTLWGLFLVQFALFFAFFFVVFSTMHPERYFIDFCTISNTFPKTFGEVFGEGWES